MASNRKSNKQTFVVPHARPLSEKEQCEVNHYRHLRERFHEGPYYSVLDTSSSSAKKGSAARANFDPFHGMPSYSGRYQKKRRTLPKVANIGREYGEHLDCLKLVSAS
jgi:DNA-directed RNA polymerase III subunit RPC7